MIYFYFDFFLMREVDKQIGYFPGFLPVVGDPDSVSQGLKLLPPIPVMPLVLFALLWCNREGRGVEEGRKKRKKERKK